MKQLETDICPGSAALKFSESEHCSYIFSLPLSMKIWLEQGQSTFADVRGGARAKI